MIVNKAKDFRSKLRHFIPKIRLTQKMGISVVMAALLLVLTAFGLYSSLSKEVTVHTNDEMIETTTRALTVEELLDELEITYKPEDIITPSLSSEIEADMHITIVEAVYVTLNHYRQQQHFWTTASTVEELLDEQGIELKDGDVVTPGLSYSLEDELTIEIAHYEYEIVERKYQIAYTTVKKDDDSMLKGQQQTLQSGANGKNIQRYKITYKNGEEISREPVGDEQIKDVQEEVIAVGTVPSLQRGNYVFAPSRTLQNVVLTAYAAGPVHTGKSPGDPGYGITASGTRATEGRTVAVDPNVIPIGTWMYIEGIGLRRAEDTGSAVQGHKIDVYFESDSQARAFGLRRGYTVHIIGSQKPSTISQ